MATERRALGIATLAFGCAPPTTTAATTSYVERIRKSKVHRGKPTLLAPPPAPPKPPSPKRKRPPAPEPAEESPEDIEIPGPGSNLVRRVTLVDTITQRKRVAGHLRATPPTPTLSNQSPEVPVPSDDLSTSASTETMGDGPPPTSVLSLSTPSTDPRGYSRTNRAIWSSGMSKSLRTTPPRSTLLRDGSVRSGDVTPTQLVAEMDVLKCILVREATFEHFGRLAAVVDGLALELRVLLLPSQVNRRASRTEGGRDGSVVSLEAPPSRAKTSKLKAELAAKRDVVVRKLRHAIGELVALLPRLQNATVDAVLAVDTWARACETPPPATLQFKDAFGPRHEHFMYQGSNYLMKLLTDVQPFFHGLAVRIVLGPDVRPHPLLVPNGAAGDDSYAVFLTQSSPDEETSAYTLEASVAESMCQLILPHVANLVPSTPSIDVNDPRVAAALARLFDEPRRVDADDRAAAARRRAFDASYDPFAALRQHDSVDDVFNGVLDATKEATETLKRALRTRQQDPARLPPRALLAPPAMHVNVTALEAKAKERRMTSASFVAAAPRQRGHVLVRRPPDAVRTHPLLEPALKIQAQYRRHKFRVGLLAQLVRFSAAVHAAARDIQRVYRGHVAKGVVATIKNELLAHTFLAFRSARKIQRQFRISQAMSYERAKAQYLEAARRKRLQDAVVAEGMERKMTEVYRAMGRRRRLERLALAEQATAEHIRMLRIKTHAAITIQACYRGFERRRALDEIRAARLRTLENRAAVSIQCLARCLLAKMRLKALRCTRDTALVHLSATKIQAAFRGHLHRHQARGPRYRKRASYRRSPVRRRSSAMTATYTSLPPVAKATPSPAPRRTRRSLLAVPAELLSPRDYLPPLRRASVKREELKLKEPTLGDNF
ncbi:hypothetical protein ACHHYP_05986 [Achlya hypogyna]|uniref:Uncharacterized protein n=1 Tax=Achlya hypogyna TaxID=1202772 RepID=A0A1V9YVX3_ACHHY|nr:hypothetical protein ACHHYP_05986 [Achlya hypogyna]